MDVQQARHPFCSGKTIFSENHTKDRRNYIKEVYLQNITDLFGVITDFSFFKFWFASPLAKVGRFFLLKPIFLLSFAETNPIIMKQYTQEEIDFLQRSLSGEEVQGRIPNGTELQDVITLVNQGKLKPKMDDEIVELAHRTYWSSASPTW